MSIEKTENKQKEAGDGRGWPGMAGDGRGWPHNLITHF